MDVKLEVAIVAGAAAIFAALVTGIPGIIIAIAQIKKENMTSVYLLLEATEREKVEAQKCCDAYRREVLELTGKLLDAMQDENEVK